MGPFHLQFLLFLPRVTNVMMALMTAPQNPQGSVILWWHPRMICFLPGPCAFLQAPTKHPGKLSVNLCQEVLLGLAGPFLVWIPSWWLILGGFYPLWFFFKNSNHNSRLWPHFFDSVWWSPITKFLWLFFEEYAEGLVQEIMEWIPWRRAWNLLW